MNITDYEKLYVNTDYIFDVVMWTDTDSVINSNGEKLSLKHIIATQISEHASIDIHVNVASNSETCDTYDIDIMELQNGEELKKCVLGFIEAHSSELQYA